MRSEDHVAGELPRPLFLLQKTNIFLEAASLDPHISGRQSVCPHILTLSGDLATI